MVAVVGSARFQPVVAGTKKEARRRAAEVALRSLAEQGRVQFASDAPLSVSTNDRRDLINCATY